MSCITDHERPLSNTILSLHRLPLRPLHPCLKPYISSRCECKACSGNVQDPTYTPERDFEDDRPPSLGKHKQGSIAISSVKRVKADSINTTIKKLVNEAAVSAAKASSSVGFS
jgi:hypothetical protein